MSNRRTIARTLRWTARLWSLASIAFVGAFVVGELFSEAGPAPTPREWVGLALFPIGVLAGMPLAWWKEKLGGSITLASLAGFYTWDWLLSGTLPTGPFFILLALPGALFLAASLLDESPALSARQAT